MEEFVVSMLATHASGPGSMPVAGGEKREINFSAPQHYLGCVLLVSRISHKNGGAFAFYPEGGSKRTH